MPGSSVFTFKELRDTIIRWQLLIETISSSQDSLPPRPFREIKAQIEQELGKPLDAVFQSVEPSPIACASIAQVHKARLLNGKDVVIKIQHAKVAYRLLQDLKNLETIGNVVRSLDPDFDFSPVIREWAREIPKELDFRCEARSMQRVERNLAHLAPAQLAADGGGCDDTASLSIDVSFPQVFPQRCSASTFRAQLAERPASQLVRVICS
jgi:predicted unusual protein kinase regulating ubiquinone biosynthesis (AarF/ABC1/UbiB family)